MSLHLISFEEVAKFLQIDAAPRSQYRGRFLTTAATKRKNIWTREQDDATDELWEAAYQLAVHEFPILEMRRLKAAKNNTWADFRPRDMPTQPKRVYIRLKGNRGYVDLTFSSTTAHEFATKLGSSLSVGMTIHQTAGAAAIRLEVPSFAIADGLKEGLPKLRQALIASQELIRFYREHRTRLDRAAADATPQ
jgi:hypothetical protein